MSGERDPLGIVRTCRLVDFAVPADHREKIKENKKRGKYLDLAGDLKMLWNIKETLIPNVIVWLGTVPNEIERGQE